MSKTITEGKTITVKVPNEILIQLERIQGNRSIQDTFRALVLEYLYGVIINGDITDFKIDD
jgi:hypothetical protein